MGDREEEMFDELLLYLEEKYADEKVECRSDAIDSAWVAHEALKRLVLADLRAKEEFGEVPAFEDTVDEFGNPVKVPNQALKRILKEYSDLVREAPPWEQGSMAYNLMRERQELAEAWKNFGWKRQAAQPGSVVEQQKLRLRELEMIQPWGDNYSMDVISLRKKRKEQKMPKLSKKEKAFLHKEDCAPDPRDIETYRTKNAGAWVVYDAHEREHFELNKTCRGHQGKVIFSYTGFTPEKLETVGTCVFAWEKGLTRRKPTDSTSHSSNDTEETVGYFRFEDRRQNIEVNEVNVLLEELEEYNSNLDVKLRDDMDMVLPDYPVDFHDGGATREGILAFESLKENWDFSGYNRDVDGGFCHWLRERGGRDKLLDLVDDVKYYIAHAPRFGHEPIVMLKGIKYQQLTKDGPDPEAVYLTQEGRNWHFTDWDGEPSNKFSTDHVVNRVEALVGRWLCETETLPTRINADRAGTLEPVNWDANTPRFKTLMAGTRVLRQSCCSHCSNRLGERGSWYWNMVNSLSGMYATQFKETGDLGAYTLFVKDNVDCRWTQQKILGDQLYESPDTWKIQGKSGDWKCLLCGRSKIFRGYFVRVSWTSGPTFRKSRIKHGPYKGGATAQLGYGKRWSALVRLAGENVMDRVKQVCG